MLKDLKLTYTETHNGVAEAIEDNITQPKRNLLAYRSWYELGQNQGYVQ